MKLWCKFNEYNTKIKTNRPIKYQENANKLNKVLNQADFGHYTYLEYYFLRLPKPKLNPQKGATSVKK